MNTINVTTPDQATITDLVIAGLKEAMAMSGVEAPVNEETYLIGRDAVLDSMGLVTLVVDLEQRLEEEFDVSLVLADERAMSQKNSPFRSVRSLSEYIGRMIEEQG